MTKPATSDQQPATKLGAKELRVSQPTRSDLVKIKRRDVFIICDNVLDTYNIGSIFRLADAVAAKCVFLCGQSETPPNSRISKAAVGTEKWVPWQYASTAVEAIADVRKRHSRLDRESRSIDSRFRGNDMEDSEPLDVIASVAKQSNKKIATDSSNPHNDKSKLRIVAIEQGKGSVDFRKVKFRKPVAFIVGHETGGVSKEALKLVDQIVEIPMFGVNESLNVMVSLAIVVYQAIG